MTDLRKLRAKLDLTACDLHVASPFLPAERDPHYDRVNYTDVKGDESLYLLSCTQHWTLAHLFVMTGAVPNTTWLKDCVVLDAKGFIKTGFDLSAEELSAAKQPPARRPYLLETSLPGVFAAGDVRGENVKRVASAVGEGSIAIRFVHQLLRE